MPITPDTDKHLSRKVVEDIIKLANKLYPPEEYQSPKTFTMGELANLFIQELETPNPNRSALVKFMQELSQNELAELMAVMWVGRGTSDPNNWNSTLKEARDNLSDAVGYMVGKFPLARYLQNGLDILQEIPGSPFWMNHEAD